MHTPNPWPRPRPAWALRHTLAASACLLALAAPAQATPLGTQVYGTAELLEFSCTTCPFGPGELLSDLTVGSLENGSASSALIQQHLHRYAPHPSAWGAHYEAYAMLQGPDALPQMGAFAGTLFQIPAEPFGGYEPRLWADHPDWPYDPLYNPALRYSALVEATAIQQYSFAHTGEDPLDYRLTITFDGSILGDSSQWASAEVWLYANEYDPDSPGGGESASFASASSSAIGFGSAFVNGSLLGAQTQAKPFDVSFDIDFQLYAQDTLFVVAQLTAGSNNREGSGYVDARNTLQAAFTAGDTALLMPVLAPVPEPHAGWLALAGALWLFGRRRLARSEAAA